MPGLAAVPLPHDAGPDDASAFVEWAHFFSGTFIEESGASEDVDVWYLSIQGTF